MDRFENYNTGRGSKTHKDYLKKKIIGDLHKIKNKINIEELNNRAEKVLERYKKNPSDDLKKEMITIQNLMMEALAQKE